MQPVAERAGFLEHIERNKISALSSNPEASGRSFTPDHVVHSYLTPLRIIELLRCYGLPESYWEVVQADYRKVFSILLVVDRASFLPHFTQSAESSDTQLPFKQPTMFPSGCSGFYEDFYKAQWAFCALPFKRVLLNEARFCDELIIPCVKRRVLKDDVDARTYVVEIEPSYNDLVAKNENGYPVTNTFVLKTCPAKDARYYVHEVEAYQYLIDEVDVYSYIPKIYGSWFHDGHYNFLVEFVDGETLDEFFEHAQPPTRGEDILEFWTRLSNLIKIIEIIHDVPVSGKESHHPQGIHHHINPSSILVSNDAGTSGFDVTFKLADPGLPTVQVQHQKNEAADRRCMQGTQMYSAPESCPYDEFHEPSNLHSRTSKDIWSLGCVWSEAAAWSVRGPSGVDDYRKRRTAETERIPALRGSTYSGCFHDGTRPLIAVAQTHLMLQFEPHPATRVISHMSEIIEDMLVEAASRPDAGEVHRRTQRALRTSKELLNNTIHDHILTSSEAAYHVKRKHGIGISSAHSGQNLEWALEQHSIEDNDPNLGFPSLTVGEVLYWIKRSNATRALKGDRISHTTLTPYTTTLVTETTLIGDHNLKKLHGRDKIFLIDDSITMGQHWPGVTRTFSVLEYLVQKSDLGRMDIFFTSSPQRIPIQDRTRLMNAISRASPRGESNMKAALGKILKDVRKDLDEYYGKHKRQRLLPTKRGQEWGVNIYVLTDGVWQKRPQPLCGVEEPIATTVKKLSEYNAPSNKVGIQFIRFGNDPVGAARLDQLDFRLKKLGIDMSIVDTEHSTGNVWKMLVGSFDQCADCDPVEEQKI